MAGTRDRSSSPVDVVFGSVGQPLRGKSRAVRRAKGLTYNEGQQQEVGQ